MSKLSEWFRSHPILSIFAAFLAVGLCAHFFLNWQSERRWQAYAKAARARGVKLYLTDFAPPEIPDAENFAALPMMRAIFQPGAKSPMALPPKDRPSFGDPLKGERHGQWAVSVSGNWRLVFEFEGTNITNVDVVDYH